VSTAVKREAYFREDAVEPIDIKFEDVTDMVLKDLESDANNRGEYNFLLIV
jgi:hypothetical protein